MLILVTRDQADGRELPFVTSVILKIEFGFQVLPFLVF